MRRPLNYSHSISIPLRPEELVTDDTLRKLAKGDADRQHGGISDEDQAMLVMILPDLCGELLARRATMGTVE